MNIVLKTWLGIVCAEALEHKFILRGRLISSNASQWREKTYIIARVCFWVSTEEIAAVVLGVAP